MIVSVTFLEAPIAGTRVHALLNGNEMWGDVVQSVIAPAPGVWRAVTGGVVYEGPMRPPYVPYVPPARQAMTPDPEMNPTLRGFLLTFGIGIAVIITFLAARPPTAVTRPLGATNLTPVESYQASLPPPVSNAHMGDNVTLVTNDPNLDVVGAVSEEVYSQLEKTYASHDRDGFIGLALSGQLGMTPNGTRGLVIDSRLWTVRVRLLDGFLAGRAYWFGRYNVQ